MPAHNEEESLQGAVESVLGRLTQEHIACEIVCVNDSSTDNTLGVIKKLAAVYPQVKLVNRQAPAGFGRAIKDGLAQVAGDVVVFAMADLSDDPEDIVRYFRKIEEGYDCVFGSRFIRGSKIYDYPWFKLFLNRLANRFIQLLFLTRFNDITNAFKMYRMEVVRSCLPLVSLHFNVTVEIPLKALTRGFTAAQIPIKWYGRKSGVSKLKLKVLSRKYMFTVFYVWLESILLKDDINIKIKR